MVLATRSASWPAEPMRADRVGELARRLRQQLDRLQRPLAQEHEARLDLGAAALGLVDQLEAGGEERVAADEFEDAEALLARQIR